MKKNISNQQDRLVYLSKASLIIKVIVLILLLLINYFSYWVFDNIDEFVVWMNVSDPEFMIFFGKINFFLMWAMSLSYLLFYIFLLYVNWREKKQK